MIATATVPEAKIDAMARLRDAGLWDEFTLSREAIRRQLRDEGIGREEAVAEAWRQALLEYPRPEDEAASNAHFAREAIQSAVELWQAKHHVELMPEALAGLYQATAVAAADLIEGNAVQAISEWDTGATERIFAEANIVRGAFKPESR